MKKIQTTKFQTKLHTRKKNTQLPIFVKLEADYNKEV